MASIQFVGYVKNLRPIKALGEGRSVLSFSVAEPAWSRERDKHMIYWNVVLFGKLAERMAPMLTDRMQVTIFGSIVEREQDKDGVKIKHKNVVAEHIHIPTKGDVNSGAAHLDESKHPTVGLNDDSDIPF